MMTYNSRIDPEWHLGPPTLLTRGMGGVGKDGDTAAFVAHEHVALAGRDEVELGDDEAQVAHDLLLWIRARKFVDIGECEEWALMCLLKVTYHSLQRLGFHGEWRVDMLFLGQTLREGA